MYSFIAQLLIPIIINMVIKKLPLGWTPPKKFKMPKLRFMDRSDKFKVCLKKTLEFEGGKDDDPHDPGGRTAYGIIQSEYNKYRKAIGLPVQDVWKISNYEIESIYYEGYWVPLKCDELPSGTDFVMFDYGVNSGLSRAIKHAQSVLKIDVDGKFGPKTLEALKNADPIDFIDKLDDKRLSFLQSLSLWKRYGRGWGSRVLEGRKFAKSLVNE